MKRHSLIIFAVFASIFVVYFCVAAIDFYFLYDHQDETVLLHTRSSSGNANKTQSEFCLQLYATLFSSFDEEHCTVQDLVFDLSNSFNVSESSFYVDTISSASGLPLFFCTFNGEKSCINTKTFKKLEFSLNFNHFPSNIDVIATFFKSQNLDVSVNLNQSSSVAITWPVLKERQCQDHIYDRSMHFISLYNNSFVKKKINCLWQYLHFICVTWQTDLLVLLKNNIPEEFMLEKNVKESKAIRSRFKRSILKPSPGIAPSMMSTPFIPTRKNLYTSHMESTPTFLLASPKTKSTSGNEVEMRSVTIADHPAFSTTTPNFQGGSTQTSKDLSGPPFYVSTSREQEESGSFSGSGKEGSGRRLPSSVESRTNSYDTTSFLERKDFAISSERAESGSGSASLSSVESSSSFSNATLFIDLQSYFVSKIFLRKITAPDRTSQSSAALYSTATKNIFELTDTQAFIENSSVKTTSKSIVASFPEFKLAVTTTKGTKTSYSTHLSNTTSFVPVTTFTSDSSTFAASSNSNAKFEKTNTNSHDFSISKTQPIIDTTSFLADPIAYTLTATVGKIFLMNIPESWNVLLKNSNAKIKFSEEDIWLFYEPQLAKVVGVPLTKTKKTFALLISVYAPYTLTKPPDLLLKIEVHSKALLANPSYIVETNFSASAKQLWLAKDTKSLSSELSRYCALFILKLSKFLTHVDLEDVSIISASKSEIDFEHQLFHSTTINVRWFIEKFTLKTFSKHYKLSILNHDNEEVTRDFFFALLPEFILDSTKVIIPISSDEVSIMDSTINPAHARTTVAIPIVVVVVFILLATFLFIWRYRRKKERFGKNALIDRTYAKRRKPVCFESELEMYNYRPSKPKILSEDFDIETELQNWNETIFSAPVDELRRESNSDTTSSDQFETGLNQFEQRNSGSYSFVNACFMPNDDCNSMASVTYDDEMAAKKGD